MASEDCHIGTLYVLDDTIGTEKGSRGHDLFNICPGQISITGGRLGRELGMALEEA